MSKITYLFGAGASAECVPVVSEISKRFRSFVQWLNELGLRNNPQYDYNAIVSGLNQTKAHEALLKDARMFANEISDHHSVDTYAKKLWIQKKTEQYRNFQAILTCFLIYEQHRVGLDKRYDSFFASILGDTEMDFGGNIRIISWNYDYQFEKAYSIYAQRSSLNAVQSMLHVYPSNFPVDQYVGGFAIFKLNGTCAFYNSSGIEALTENLWVKVDQEFADRLVYQYARCAFSQGKFQSMLSFAWEGKFHKATSVVHKAIHAMEGTDVLVIIGYSIPFFNREVDRELFKCLPIGKKIIIQDCKPDIVESRLKNYTSIKPEIQSDVDQFVLPHEL